MEFGIEYVAILVAISEAAKEFGVKTRAGLILVAMITGMALSLGLDLLPEYTMMALRGLMLGLAAAGLYRGGKRAGSAIIAKVGNGNASPGQG